MAKSLDIYCLDKGGMNYYYIKAGDCVQIQPQCKPICVARVENIQSDARGFVKLRVRWYYRPEEAIGGRRHFHGANELFLSDEYDTKDVDMIFDKCTVHTFQGYINSSIRNFRDYYCRFEYETATGKFIPHQVDTYCKCELQPKPETPIKLDQLMVRFEGSKEWRHPACVGMKIEEAKPLEHFQCSVCSSAVKNPQ